LIGTPEIINEISLIFFTNLIYVILNSLQIT